MTKDIVYMKKAIELAKNGIFTTDPNPSVGCVIVNNNEIVGTGYHIKQGSDHAEIAALKMAGTKSYKSVVYVTLEPCSHFKNTSSCCEALIKAGVKKIVISIKDPNPIVCGNGIKMLKQSGIEIIYGLMLNEAHILNKGFFNRMETGIPLIRLKLAMSIDGKTSLKNGSSKWITSYHARHNSHIFRASSSAMLTTSKTILSDNPSFTIRLHESKYITKEQIETINNKKIIRMIIDSKNKVLPTHNIVSQPGETWLIRTKRDACTAWPTNVRQLILPSKNKYVDVNALLSMLGEKNINTVLVESGPTFAGALLQMNLIDELIIYISPKILGNNAKCLFNTCDVENLKFYDMMKFSDISYIGNDVRLILNKKHNNYKLDKYVKL